MKGELMSKKIILFALLIAMFSGLSFAQMGQVGAIRGTVTIQDEGMALSDVTVTLRSPAIILLSLTAVTNERGQYRFLNLSPGTYELTFEITGFATVIRKDIIVHSNMTFTVNVSMSPEKLAEVITVTGRSPTVDRQSTAKTTTLDKNFLTSVPAGRDLNYFLNMTPGATGNSTMGATVRDNMYAVDGIQINDPSVGTITGNPLSIEIMEEISVQAGGASAEWGAVKGGIINAVTKSGGNSFSGDVQFLYENENLKSDNTKGTPFEGRKSGNKFWMEPSGSLGGPLVKDKVWFFANYTYRGWKYFIPKFPHDGPAIPLKDKSSNPYMKLTFQPNPSDKLILAASYQIEDQLPTTGSQWSNLDSVRNVKRVITVPSLHWIHTWGPKFVSNFKLGLLSYKWDFTPTANGAKPFYEEDTTYFSTNGCGFADLYQRTRVQANADGTLFVDDLAGSHEIKFGIQNSFHYTRRTGEVYGPKDAGGLIQGWLYKWEGVPYYASWAASFVQKARSLNSGLFLNDSWNISKRLTFNLGLRLDYQWNYTPKQVGTVGGFPAEGSLAYLGLPDMTWDMDIEANFTHYKWLTLSPRLGMIFDILGDGSTLLKANFSQYLQDNYTAMTWFVSPVGWIWIDGYTNADGSLSSIDGAWVPGSTMKMGYPGHELVAPRTYEAVIGLERELFEDVSVGARFIRRWDRKLIEDADGSSLDMKALMDEGKIVWDAARWKPVQYTDPFDNKTVTFYRQMFYRTGELYLVNPPGLDRDYKSFEFTLKKRFSKGWSFDFSYVYSNSTGLVQNTYWESELDEPIFNNPNAHVNALGSMALERPHMLKLSGLVKGPLGINISGYFRFLSGYATPRTLSSWNAGLGFSQTVMAEKFGSYYLPDQFIIDFRLEKEFKIGDTLTLRAFGDAYNLMNKNTVTGWNNLSNSRSQKFRDTNSILDSRVFRLGARIEFNL
jgi:hypothetical protein